jgi:hypothetical protein
MHRAWNSGFCDQRQELPLVMLACALSVAADV